MGFVYKQWMNAVLVGDGSFPIDLDSIELSIEASLARFKQPRKLIIAQSLPRNTMGKVQKNILRDTYHSVLSE